jgi:ABC-type uncharacterized transport system substrate-binding protein
MPFTMLWRRTCIMTVRYGTVKKFARTSSWLVPALLFLFLLAPAASAHPHVFVDYGLTFVFDQKGLSGIAMEWAFDEMFTQMLLEEGDLNRDRRFDSREIAAIKSGAFDNLANYAWFTRILVNGRPFQITAVTSFKAVLKNGRAHYSFFIPCRVPAGGARQQVSLTLYDPTNYTDLALTAEGIHYSGPADRYQPRHEETLAQEVGFADAPLLPDGILLEFKSP